jgi:hypothetical protein
MTVGFFPTLHADELLYSGCAKYLARAGYRSAKQALSEIFGAATAGAIVDLPCRLSEFEAALPRGHGYTAERLIDEHTLAPFFCSFLPPEQVRCVRHDMLGNKGSAVHRRLGITASRIPLPDRLRYCPRCAETEAALLDEPYWHRLHQLPGVIICPRHAIFLEESEGFTRHPRNNWRLIPAKALIHSLPSRSLNPGDTRHAVLAAVARDSEWLLNNPRLSSEPDALRNRYLRLLIDRGFATYSGSIHVGKLLNSFKRHFPVSVLKHLGCELAGRGKIKDNWLLRLVRKNNHSHHPLYHLLLINMLGSSVEKFFSLPSELQYFGEGPWPCLNPAAAHYLKDHVTDCRVTFRGENMKPVGTFSCDCGFVFARTGPDADTEDRFRTGRIKSFGSVWEEELKCLWQRSDISVRRCCIKEDERS